MSREVPRLNLLNYVDGNPQQKKNFIEELMFGLKEFGFIVLSEHTVDQEKVDHAYKYLESFYKLPLDIKMKYSGNNGGQRGYTAFGVEHAKNNTNPDLKEFWHVGRSLLEDSPYQGEYPENVWPSEVPQFEESFRELYKTMDETAGHLLDAIGVGLGVAPSYFKEMINDGNSILRAIHYPPTTQDGLENSIRAGAHEDINLITLLVGATSSGLELLDKNGTWLPVKSKPGEIIVDTGDMMSRITNNILPATTHRVVNPEKKSSRRFSMPYFVHPHSNAELNCIESCIGSGRKYEDISAGEFLKQRLKEIGLM